MSGVYRIDVEHHPEDAPSFPVWSARIVRLSDDEVIATKTGDRPDEAVDRAQECIRELHRAQQGFSVYTDESGAFVPESVKA